MKSKDNSDSLLRTIIIVACIIGIINTTGTTKGLLFLIALLMLF